MTAAQWIQQSAATLAKVPADKLYGKGTIGETDRASMRVSAESFSEHLFIDESSPLQITELVSQCQVGN